MVFDLDHSPSLKASARNKQQKDLHKAIQRTEHRLAAAKEAKDSELATKLGRKLVSQKVQFTAICR